MNKLLDETIRRLEKELTEAKELKKRSKASKKPVQVHEVKKIIENIKSIEQQSQQRYKEVTEHASEGGESEEENEEESPEKESPADTEMSTPVATTNEEGDYVPPPDPDEEAVTLPPSKKRKRTEGGNSTDQPFKDKAVNDKIKNLHGRAKGADGKPMKNPFAHLKNAGEYFEQTAPPVVEPENADDDTLLKKGGKMDFYATVVPTDKLIDNPIVSALNAMGFNVAKTIPYWLETNLDKTRSFGALVDDFTTMQGHLENKNPGLLMAIKIFKELDKSTGSVHEFTANKEEIKNIKTSLMRDVGDKKPAKETLKSVMEVCSSAHTKSVVEAVFNATAGKK